MENKSRTSLSLKLYFLIIILVFATSCLSISAGYMEHKQTTDEFYQDLAENIAETVSNSLNGTRVKLLIDAAQDPGYQAILTKAREEQNAEGIIDYLDEKRLLLTYDNINETLVQYTQYMEVEFIYLQYIGDGYFCRIIDPDDGYFSYGLTDALDGPYIQYSGQNIEIPATISQTSDGLLCTCFEPVYDSEGTPVAVVGVDVSMEMLYRKHKQFAVTSLLSALLLAALASIAGVFFMSRNVTKPIEQLCRETRKFTNKKGHYTLKDVIDLDIHSNDEIEDLYDEIKGLEKKIVEYLDHLVKVTGEKERVRTELGIAAQIQNDMLPRKFPAFPDRTDFDLYATMHPAREVGGDFYDYYLLDDDHLVLAIADVSGKGIPAALFMAITKSLLKVGMTPGDTPSSLLTRINNQIVKGNTSGMFVSVWLAILELSTGKLTASNAGHEYPALSRASQPFELVKDKHSLVMAAMENIPYSEYTITLQPGDRIFVYTDGVVEANNPEVKLYGTDRMIEALNEIPDANPQQLVNNVSKSIKKFARSAAQFDDITMVALVYKPEE